MAENESPFSLKNHFLLAMPNLPDDQFSQSLTYICDHSDDGAMGIVINKPLQLNLAKLLDHIDITPTINTLEQIPVLNGGPVQGEQGFVLHRLPGQWQSSLIIEDEVQLTTSKDILQAIASQPYEEDYIVALGYAGWGKGQLEQEIANNAWLYCKADYDILFQTPIDKKLEEAARLLGVDWHLISPDAGHA